jgi:hypothetical protein
MKAKTEKRSPLKDKPLRYAGQYLDEQIEDKRSELLYWVLVPSIIIFFAIRDWFRFFNPPPAHPIYITIVAIPVLTWGINKIIQGKREIERLRMARDGEKLVAEELQEMIKQGATVLNDIQGDNFNIDHVVISKHGIFLIETKTYSKPVKKEPKITYDNENVYLHGKSMDRNPINQVKASASWLQNLLKESTGIKYKVHPVILFPGWFIERNKSTTDFWVLNPKALSSFIPHEHISLAESEVHLVTFHLSRYVRTYTSK